MVTYATSQYFTHFKRSLDAKLSYANHWGYSWKVFDEDSLDCSAFRPLLWRGDYRYCKLEALKVMWSEIERTRQREADPAVRHVLFWHDVDTHIMQPEVPLQRFLDAAGPGVFALFTDNALSLNNGVFFLEASDAGGAFLEAWRHGCRSGVWPWADNGCMYEVLLRRLGGERYGGRCAEFREPEHDDERPEPRTGARLMRCFNEEMDSLGMGCCGSRRGISGIALLSGPESSFNDHPCDELAKNPDFTPHERAKIKDHCFSDGMFLVHSKSLSYAKTSEKRMESLGKSRAQRSEL